MKPIIGITSRAFSKVFENPQMALHGWGTFEDYLSKVQEAGAIPIILSPYIERDDIKTLLSRCNGILLPGGEDISPNYYGEDPAPQLGETCPKRDIFEITLAKLAIESRTPLLGICRGSQLLNVALGGTLVQHLDNHPATVATNSCSENSGTQHEVTVSPDSKLEGIYLQSKILVNTYHHQCVKGCASDLTVPAIAEDGVPEAVEHKDRDFFCLGVQWHPEMLNDTGSKNFFQDLCRLALRLQCNDPNRTILTVVSSSRRRLSLLRSTPLPAEKITVASY